LNRLRGQSVLYAVLLMPTLIIVFALAVDIGMLQMQKLRLRYAVDLATVSAAEAVDRDYYGRTGRLQLDPIAASLAARDYLQRNLDGMPEVQEAGLIAAAAEVTVINRVPSLDPYTGARIDRPAVCARIRVPHRFLLLGWIGMESVEIRVAANAEIRI
jgi:Putative Flp pilus-assembly TadE/G-like